MLLLTSGSLLPSAAPKSSISAISKPYFSSRRRISAFRSFLVPPGVSSISNSSRYLWKCIALLKSICCSCYFASYKILNDFISGDTVSGVPLALLKKKEIIYMNSD